MLLPVQAEGGAFFKACQLTGQRQRERLVVELGNAGAVKTHPGLYLRKAGLKQAPFGAEDQRQGEAAERDDVCHAVSRPEESGTA